MPMEMTKPIYDARQITDLRDLIHQSVELYGNNVVFLSKDKKGEIHEITYHQYQADIYSLGTVLCELTKPGDRIAVAGHNCYEWCLSYMAASCGARVIVPVDRELLAPDIFNIINVSESKVILCDERFAKKILNSDEKLPEGTVIYCFGKEDDGDDTLSFPRLLEKGREMFKTDKSYSEIPIDPNAMSTLLFTSGTTGLSKGVMLCQRNLCSDVYHAMQVVKGTENDRMISILPLHHTYECTMSMFMAIYCGASIAFCESLKYVVKNMQEYKPTVFVSVPLLLEKVHKKILKNIEDKKNGSFKFKVGKYLCKVAEPLGIDLKSKFFKEIQDVFGGRMRLVITGAAPINPQILEDFDAFGIQIIFGYGLTECAPLVICNNDKLHLTKSIGVPLPNVEIDIINKDPETGIGELCVRGPMVMLGYYNDTHETNKVLSEDGWFRTGDLGYVDKKGHYFITGRCKNIIVTKNGKNIYPEEVEYYLNAHPFVEECVVLGGEDKNGDTIVEASIFPNFEELTEKLGHEFFSDDELREIFAPVIEEVNTKLPHFKHITAFNVRHEEFIKTTTKKIQRFRLNDQEKKKQEVAG